MRSYRQYCWLARGLDLIGDRWVLLIVRELSPGPRRYGELLHGLPGIATNLLAERLRTMEASGLVTHDGDDYALTEQGAGLRPVLRAIGQWAAPLMGPQEPDEAFRSHWIEHPMTALFPGEDRSRPDLEIEVRCGERPMTVRSVEGRVRVEPGPAAAPDILLTGPADAVLGLLTQRLTVEQAKAHGLAVTGDARPLRRLRPLAAAGNAP